MFWASNSDKKAEKHHTAYLTDKPFYKYSTSIEGHLGQSNGTICHLSDQNISALIKMFVY